MTHHLAQINIARLLAPIDDPRIADFVAQLDEINKLAEQSPGFVWRLKSDSGNATDVVFNDDPFVIVNMSVWESIEALRGYAYTSKHVDVFRRRAEWFEKMDKPQYCLWWVPGGGTFRPSPRRGSGWSTISSTARVSTRFGFRSSIRLLSWSSGSEGCRRALLSVGLNYGLQGHHHDRARQA